MIIIDAHSHLWESQDTKWNGKRIKSLPNGRAEFLGEEVQMLPPFMTDGRNSAEVFLSNMDYAQVGGAVVVQEFIDGIQNTYLSQVQTKYPNRFFVHAMCDYFTPGFADEASRLLDNGFRGIAIPGHRLITDKERIRLNSDEMMKMFHDMERRGAVLSLCLADGDTQVGEVSDVVSECPDLRITIGHFGMPTSRGWHSQLDLCLHTNIYLESGGITWLYNSEFYPFPTAMRVIREAIDRVGIDKLMWGSDYPRTITAITYRMSYDFVLKSDLLTEKEKEQFLGKNAMDFYGFNHLPELPYIKNMSE